MQIKFLLITFNNKLVLNLKKYWLILNKIASLIYKNLIKLQKENPWNLCVFQMIIINKNQII